MNNLEHVIGVDDAAKLWGLSPGYIKNLCASGRVVSKKIGKTWVIDDQQPNPKGASKMRAWETELVIVNEVLHDQDLHAFEVSDKAGNVLGSIYPADVETMNQLISDLDDGDCPIADAWEDGMGNICTMDGWG